MTSHEPNLTKTGERLPPISASRKYWTTGPSPRIRGRSDWRFAAEQLALGQTPEEIAPVIGLQPRRIREHIRRSARFRRLIALCAANDGAAAAAKLLGLRKLVADYLERHLHRGDEKTARFLAKSLGVFDGAFLAKAGATAERAVVDRELTERLKTQVQKLLSNSAAVPGIGISKKQYLTDAS